MSSLRGTRSDFASLRPHVCCRQCQIDKQRCFAALTNKKSHALACKHADMAFLSTTTSWSLFIYLTLARYHSYSRYALILVHKIGLSFILNYKIIFYGRLQLPYMHEGIAFLNLHKMLLICRKCSGCKNSITVIYKNLNRTSVYKDSEM